MPLTQEDLNQIAQLLRPIEERINKRLDRIEERLDRIEERFDRIEHRLGSTEASWKNSLIGRDEPITPVPINGAIPEGVEFPRTISQLLVSGSERKADSTESVRADWNIQKSKILLTAYQQQFSDNESDGSGEEETKMA
eukprot:c6825_g1_i1.p1 GENE.c6825_g1_i1~~c6825_g1_i1.p1  ORF type:complete len:153 (+),score=15.14 c6825_g1_i1:43-459(+)